MFSESSPPLPWDEEQNYTREAVELYYEVTVLIQLSYTSFYNKIHYPPCIFCHCVSYNIKILVSTGCYCWTSSVDISFKIHILVNTQQNLAVLHLYETVINLYLHRSRYGGSMDYV